MKRIVWILILLLTLALGVTSAAAQGLDRDGDGIPARLDACPRQAGPAETNGCPLVIVTGELIDLDGDGVPDATDNCPTVAGTAANQGCPETFNPPENNPPANPDSDGDGTPDSGDQCPTAPGLVDNAGCPPVDPPAEPPTNNPSGDLPPSNPPNNPPTSPDPVPDSSVPPFSPPELPTDGCFVTPANGNQINVRQEPNLGAAILGHLLPGQVYAADGYVVNGADRWFVLSVYENSAGLTGYASSTVVIGSACAELGGAGTVALPPAQPDLVANPRGEQPPLCFFIVGYDAPTWSAHYPYMESVTYAAFWFAFEPGAPIPSGTPVWGVISVENFIALPGADNAVAFASDPAVMTAAQNDPAGGGAYNWPTMNGGIEVGGTRLYRLSGADGGSCGQITSTPFNPADNFADADDRRGIFERMECFPQPGTTIVESCWCESSDSDCIDVLVDICHGGGAYVDAGPDMTACWWADDEDLQLTLYAAQASAARLDICDDLSVWWIDIPALGSAPLGLLDPSRGYCSDGLGGVLEMQRPAGASRLITHQGGGDGIGGFATDLPQGRSADKEHVGWWTKAMDLICGGGGWILATEIDADGDEVVTDAQCDD